MLHATPNGYTERGNMSAAIGGFLIGLVSGIPFGFWLARCCDEMREDDLQKQKDIFREGRVRKGGWNAKPTTPRPTIVPPPQHVHVDNGWDTKCVTCGHDLNKKGKHMFGGFIPNKGE